jgi:hypothetical protein
MIRFLFTGALAIGLIAPISAADAASASRHQRLHQLQVRPLMQGPVSRPWTGVRDRQQKPAFFPGETWMEDGAIFGHPDDHG